MPAAIEACRAGFCPCAAVKICPRMTSETCLPSTPARESAPSIATFPSTCAESEESEPLNEPTGVRAAPTMTTSSFIYCSLLNAAGLCRDLYCAASSLIGKPDVNKAVDQETDGDSGH